MAIVQYDLLRTAAKHIVAITTTDAYRWDTAGAGSWKCITKNYSTGTVKTPANGATAFVGSTTSWAGLTGTPANFKIGVYEADGTTDTDDINLIETWYDVDSIASDTSLFLSASTKWDSSLGASGTGLKYVIRQCFSGTSDDFFSVAFPYDSGDTEKILVVTNGVDPIVRWDGADEMTDLGGASGLAAKYIGYFGSVGYEHTYLGNVTDATVSLPQALYVSEVGDPEDWSTGTFYDLLTTEDRIEGIETLGTRMMIYKTRSITESWATPSGGSTDPLDFNQNKIKDIGTPSIRTVQDLGQYHIFMGHDNVYLFDGIQVVPIGTEIVKTMLSEMNRDEIDKCFALNIRSENLYCLFIPTTNSYCDKVYAFNYVDRTWTIWTLWRQSGSTLGLMTCAGRGFEQTSPSWDDWYASDYTWDDLEGQWDDVNQFSDEIYFLGDKDGYVYKLSPVYTSDAGAAFNATVTTRDFPLNDSKHAVRLCETVLGLVDGTGYIRIRGSVDFGASWSEWISINLDDNVTTNGEYFEVIANFIERGKQVRFQIENYDGSYFELESILIGYNDQGIVN